MTGQSMFVMYDPPSLYDNTLQTLKEHLKEVQAWPDSIENKAACVAEARMLVEIKSRSRQDG